MRLLVVEDEKDLNDILTLRLKKAGYNVDSCFDGDTALDYIDVGNYDVIILDIMLPKISGIEVLNKMRMKKNKSAVILLTAKDSIEDRVNGLDCGADDYIVKPFAFDELLARIRVLTRRGVNEATNIFQVGDLTVDCNKHEVKRGGTKIHLSSKEFALLEYMIRNHGVVLTREQMEQNLYNFDYEGCSNVIDVYIRYLRKKIDHNYTNKLIHTVRGTGYVLRE